MLPDKCRSLCICWLAVFPASGARQICTTPVSACILTIYSDRGSVLCCLYRSAKFTSNLFTLRTTDENLAVFTTDPFVPTQSNWAREETSNTGCFTTVGDLNVLSTSTPSYGVQSSCQATRRMCSGVLKSTTIIKATPPSRREKYPLHGF